MSSVPHKLPPRPTLDDLLRFKRAERPAPEFWEEFDRGLRQKQLTALMQRPQGWARLRPVLFRGLRWAVPATAAAAVALVILQIPRGSNTLAPAQVVAAPEPLAVAELPIPLPVEQVAAAEPQVPREEIAIAPSVTVVAVAQPETAPETMLVAEAEPTGSSLPWMASSLSYSQPSSFHSGAFQPVRLAARETRRPHSSWTSRFTEIVRNLSAEQDDARVMQLVAMNLFETNYDGAARASSSQMLAGSMRSDRTLTERQFRNLDARLGAKGSTLAIKF